MASDVGADDLSRELAGLDQLELAVGRSESLARRAWRATWPKALAVVIALGLWQLVVWAEWKPDYVLAGPGDALSDLWDLIRDGTMATALRITLGRALKGYTLAVVIGVAIGSVVARVPVVRSAVGSLITGLQTMPSIVWFPLAILIFKLSEGAIMFVVVLGAAPSIANGLVSGADQIPPILLRAGRVLGAHGLNTLRYVVLPAAFPAFVGGLKQGWAFAWCSLMAGELLVVMQGKASVGFLLSQNQAVNDASGLEGMMVAVLVIGIVVDSLLFGTLERSVRRRWGLLETTN